MDSVIIFANGEPITGTAVEAVLASPAYVIAADGGTRLARLANHHVDLLIGDMDSMSPTDWAYIEQQSCDVRRFPAEKNETDLELALIAAVEQNPKSIWIIGATGGRVDQTIANIYLLNLPILANVPVYIVAGEQTSYLLAAGTHEITGHAGDTVSLIPLGGDVLGISTQGLQYQLTNETLMYGPARGVSNVIQSSPVQVSFAQGQVLVVHTVGRA